MQDAAQQRFTELFGPEFGHGKPFDLAKLCAVLSALGEPQEKLPPTIHVAGTNGKGSTIAFMRAISEAAGFSVHAFTKPHLFKLNERFLVAGAPADDEALIEAAERVARADASLTQFDAQVAAAFLIFSETPADLVLLETGMGGREDSTNVVAPALSIITPIGLDHQDALGATLAEIAAHKAGIIKRDTPAIIARQGGEALDIIEREAERLSVPLWRQSVEWDAFASSGRLVVQTETRVLDLPLPTLAGAHQIDNAGLACAVLLQLGLRIHDDAFAEGVANAQWPGRLTPLVSSTLNPLAPNAEIWIDAAHNAHAAHALARSLDAMNRKRPARTALIVGLRARKDWRAFVESLAPQAAQLIAVPLSEAHAPPEEIAQAARALGVEASTANDLRRALVEARGAGRILICGSFLLAAEALSAERV
jgi:dihydrofolate synthase/folylpolyglutamate synthase